MVRGASFAYTTTILAPVAELSIFAIRRVVGDNKADAVLMTRGKPNEQQWAADHDRQARMMRGVSPGP